MFHQRFGKIYCPLQGSHIIVLFNTVHTISLGVNTEDNNKL